MNLVTLRNYRNDDPPHLVRLWAQHYDAAGMPTALTPSVFEQAIMNRLLFEPENIHVAEVNNKPIGFSSWLPAAQGGAECLVPVICVSPCDQQDAAGLALLRASEKAALTDDRTTLVGGFLVDDFTGLDGLAPLGAGGGIPDSDRRASRWFMQAGYGPRHRLERYAITLATFRPPIDRHQLQLRRTAVVDQHWVLPDDQRQATALTHVEVHRFEAKSRAGEPLAEVDFWLSDPAAAVFPTAHAILANWSCSSPQDRLGVVCFLLASALQTLQARGIVWVAATAIDERPEQSLVLRALKFGSLGGGTIFAKRLARDAGVEK